MVKINEKAASGLRVFESWVESQMAYSGQPGISAAVVHDQEVVWSRGFGYADVENELPAAPDTIYRVASISNLFTSTAVMQLKEKGKLNLHDHMLEPTKLEHIEGNRFKMIASGYGSHGEEAVFEMDESGKVYRLVTGENYAEKIKSW